MQQPFDPSYPYEIIPCGKQMGKLLHPYYLPHILAHFGTRGKVNKFMEDCCKATKRLKTTDPNILFSAKYEFHPTPMLDEFMTRILKPESDHSREMYI